MHIRNGYVLKHRIGGVYLDKMAKDHTSDLFSAISFKTYDEADYWLNHSYYKPALPEDYEITEIITTKEEVSA